MKPRILIPLAQYNSHTPPVFGLGEGYVHAIVRAGGSPIMVARPTDEDLHELIRSIDGVFLAGGHDVDPNHYGEEKSECTCNIDRDRDRVEILLTQLAKEHRIPILGVCRGMQVMNVAMGGSLYQDVFTEMTGAIQHDFHTDESGKFIDRSFLAHEVHIEAASLLATIVGQQSCAVNSLHHQGIKVLADGLMKNATAPDGLIEAIAFADHSFGLGVEWHPEELNDEGSQKIFRAFIEAAMSTHEIPAFSPATLLETV